MATNPNRYWRVRPGRRPKGPVVEVVSDREQLQVWLRDGDVRQLTGTIRRDLASDARRRGEDLVGRLVDKALREADRRSATLNRAAPEKAGGCG